MLARLILALVLAASTFANVETRPSGHTDQIPQVPANVPGSITYLTPIWQRFDSASPAEIAAQAALLRSRIGENETVRVGFAEYIDVILHDWNVDLSNPAALRAGLGAFEADVDNLIQRAEANNLVLVLTLLTRIRDWVDPVQTQSFAEDRRVMQWYSDNTVATGWWTYSRYARRQYALREAYMREVARILAQKIAEHPDTLVAIAGDGEVELSIGRLNEQPNPVVADYSPFAIAEFRDWLRGQGLYADGGMFAGQASSQAARYRGDVSPGVDTNGDGHTLNGDYGTSFTSWDLRHFDWSLTDAIIADPRRLPAAIYQAPGFNPLAVAVAGGFDAPRTIAPSSAWWQVWNLFRETMVWRHNIDLARWMTSSVSVQGHAIPTDRWYSYQIPADYLFGYTPQNPDRRLVASASPWWTANVQPYAGLGFTSFATHQGGSAYARTLPGLLGAVRTCGAGEAPPTCLATPGGLTGSPWGLFEWNPAVPGTSDPALYLDEMRRLRRVRPRVLAPFAWGRADYPILNSGFELALRKFVSDLDEGWAPSVQTSPTALQFAAQIARSHADAVLTHTSGPQEVLVAQPKGGTVDWTVGANQSWLVIDQPTGHGDGAFKVSLNAAHVVALPAGVHAATVTLAAPGSIEGTRTITVSLRVTDAASHMAPVGSFDTPIQNSTVAGSIAVTGWALDDVEIDRVEIWRDRVTNDNAPGYPDQAHPAFGKVFIANGTFVAGTRPDVASAYADAPFAHRAGWGYLLLTWGFPNANGTFVLTAIAWDVEGQHTVLGTKTIHVNNATSTKPFGSIDVPAYGGTFSGHNWTYGWALTPNAGCTIAAGQRFMTVDSMPPSSAVTQGVIYGAARTDIAAAFPGFTDSAGAGGAAALDSRVFPNGTYQIGWLVYDSCGNGEGIGSRFFTIQNGSPRDVSTGASDVIEGRGPSFGHVGRTLDRPASPDPLWIVRGIGTVETAIDPGSKVWLSQTGRIEVHATRPGTVPQDGLRYEGYLMRDGTLHPLPLGSSFDGARGSFYWQPVVGFLGTFDLHIVQLRGDTPDVTWTLPITISADADQVKLHIDHAGPVLSPSTMLGAGARSLRVEGWALDPQATDGSGIGHVHVWATRRGTYIPTFLGAATLGRPRTDVGDRYGRQFDDAGYVLTVPPNLKSGVYDVVVYVWSLRTARWEAAQSVVVDVR